MRVIYFNGWLSSEMNGRRVCVTFPNGEKHNGVTENSKPVNRCMQFDIIFDDKIDRTCKQANIEFLK